MDFNLDLLRIVGAMRDLASTTCRTHALLIGQRNELLDNGQMVMASPSRRLLPRLPPAPTSRRRNFEFRRHLLLGCLRAGGGFGLGSEQPSLELLHFTAQFDDDPILVGVVAFEPLVLAFEFAVFGLNLIQPSGQWRDFRAELLNQAQQQLDGRRIRSDEAGVIHDFGNLTQLTASSRDQLSQPHLRRIVTSCAPK